MLKKFKLTILLLVSLVVLPAAATAGPGTYVQASPSTANLGFAYQGSALALNGQAPAGSEVFIKLSQKERSTEMVGEGKEGPFWLNQHKVTVDGLPGFYVVLASAPLQSLSSSLQKEMGIAPDFANLKQTAVVRDDKNDGRVLTGSGADSYLQVLFNMRVQKGIYQEKLADMDIAGDGSYKYNYWLPQYVSPGDIVVTAYAVKDGRLISKSESGITVQKTGLGGYLSGLAANKGLAYGTLAVLVAVMAGVSIDKISTVIVAGLNLLKRRSAAEQADGKAKKPVEV